MCHRPRRAKFQRFLVQRKHFQIWGLNGGNRKNVRFQRKTGHISKTVRVRAKVTINH